MSENNNMEQEQDLILLMIVRRDKLNKLKEEGKNPFILDSKEPKGNFREFLMSEVRFTSLQKKEPDIAEELLIQAEADAKERYERYRRKSIGERG